MYGKGLQLAPQKTKAVRLTGRAKLVGELRMNILGTDVDIERERSNTWVYGSIKTAHTAITTQRKQRKPALVPEYWATSCREWGVQVTWPADPPFETVA